MVKLKCIKLANSVKCGPKEETFFIASQFNIELEFPIIRITHLGLGDMTETTAFNAIYWKRMPETVTSSVNDNIKRKREVNL